MRRSTAPANSIGVVCDRAHGGAVSRVINPDFEWQLNIQVLSPSEYLIRVSKEVFGVSKAKDAMTLDQVQRVIETFAP